MAPATSRKKRSRQGRVASLWLERGSVITVDISLSKTKSDRSESKKTKGGGLLIYRLHIFASVLWSAGRPHSSWDQACTLNMFGTLLKPRSQGQRVLITYWPPLMCSVSVIIKWFLCSSVGVISPQDAVTAERDVMENYHLHRPQALECSLAGSPVSLQEEMEGAVVEWGGRVVVGGEGGERRITKAQSQS